jgi:hypothetical protein
MGGGYGGMGFVEGNFGGRRSYEEARESQKETKKNAKAQRREGAKEKRFLTGLTGFTG